jgi:large subunit ribosomal protein L25
MTGAITLSAQPRTVIGKTSHRLAREGSVPAVLYGYGREALPITVNKHDFEQLIAHHAAGSSIVELALEGEKTPINVMIREVQTSPLKDQVMHVDFLAVQMDKLISAVVTLRFVNDPVGVKAGGVLSTSFHEVNVEAKPNDLPSVIEVDVADLEVGDSIHARDLVVPAGVTVLDDGDEVIVSVQPPRVEVEEELGAEEAAEPEVIGEKAEEE